MVNNNGIWKVVGSTSNSTRVHSNYIEVRSIKMDFLALTVLMAARTRIELVFPG